jgi:hypothetical protein
MISKYVLSISSCWSTNQSLSTESLPSRHAIGSSLPRFRLSFDIHHRHPLPHVTGRYIYDRLYPEPRWTANKDKGATTSHKSFIHRPTLYDGPLDRGHHTLQNQRRHINDTQNVEKLFIEISGDSDSDLDALPACLFADSAFQGYSICH